MNELELKQKKITYIKERIEFLNKRFDMCKAHGAKLETTGRTQVIHLQTMTMCSIAITNLNLQLLDLGADIHENS